MERDRDEPPRQRRRIWESTTYVHSRAPFFVPKPFDLPESEFCAFIPDGETLATRRACAFLDSRSVPRSGSRVITQSRARSEAYAFLRNNLKNMCGHDETLRVPCVVYNDGDGQAMITEHGVGTEPPDITAQYGVAEELMCSIHTTHPLFHIKHDIPGINGDVWYACCAQLSTGIPHLPPRTVGTNTQNRVCTLCYADLREMRQIINNIRSQIASGHRFNDNIVGVVAVRPKIAYEMIYGNPPHGIPA